MDHDETWFRLYRKMESSQVFKNEGLLKVWVWCLIKATYKKRWVKIKTGKAFLEVELEPGQFIFGRDTASEKLDMHPSTVWKRMKKLKKMKNVDIDSNRQYSLVTVLNWPTYQPPIKESNSEGDNGVTAEELPSNTNKKGKKVNNVKKDIVGLYSYPDWLNIDLWKEFLSLRKIKNKPFLTDKGVKGAVNKLQNLISEGYSQKDLFDNTLSHEYLTFYPIKDYVFKAKPGKQYTEPLEPAPVMTDEQQEENLKNLKKLQKNFGMKKL